MLFFTLRKTLSTSFKQAENVRETIELSVPVCGVNSLCIVVCILLMQGSTACMLQHLAMAEASSPSSSQEAIMTTVAHPQNSLLPVLNASGISPLIHPPPVTTTSSRFVIARYQPILAALVLPFPLVCSIVCIVAAVRNHRVMVSFSFV